MLSSNNVHFSLRDSDHVLVRGSESEVKQAKQSEDRKTFRRMSNAGMLFEGDVLLLNKSVGAATCTIS